MRRIIILFTTSLFLLLTGNLIFAQNSTDSLNFLSKNKKIGLVLSGGGARGIAHIGVLKKLEEAKIKPDYIAGTSIGAIIGALYAMGYSADQIEKMVLSQDWDALFSNKSSLKSVSIEEKREYASYVMNLPIENWEFQFPKSVIGGQNITNNISKLFLPVYNINDFDSLPIPFRCIATNLETGNITILKSGNLGEAVRASVTIPTVFTPYEIDGDMMVDGGLVNNFPVYIVKEMGADFVIGSYVGTDLKAKEDLSDAFDIIYQATSFQNALETDEQKKLCDIIIEPDVSKYNVLDFDLADTLIKVGECEANTKMDALKKYSEKGYTKPHYTQPKTQIAFDNIEIKGLDNIDEQFVIQKLNLKDSVTTYEKLQKGIDRVYGTRYFESVYYKITVEDSKNTLHVYVKEQPNAFFKWSLHYDAYNQAYITLNLTVRNLILNRSRLITKVGISKSPYAKLSYFKYIDSYQNLSMELGTDYNNFSLPKYNEDHDLAYQLSYQYLSGYGRLNISPIQDFMLSLGAKYDYSINNSRLAITNNINKTKMKGFGLELIAELNTLDNYYFPTSGIHFKSSINYFFSNEYLITDSVEVETSTFIEPYTTLNASFTDAFSIGRNFTFLTKAQFATIFGTNNTVFNKNFIGGLNNTSHLTRTFTGLADMEIFSNSFLSAGGRLRYQFLPKVYINTDLNVLFVDLSLPNSSFEKQIQDPNIICGYGLGLSYDSFLGPIEVYVHQSDYSNSLKLHVGIGYEF